MNLNKNQEDRKRTFYVNMNKNIKKIDINCCVNMNKNQEDRIRTFHVNMNKKSIRSNKNLLCEHE